MHLYKMKDNKQVIIGTCQEAMLEPGHRRPTFSAPAEVLCATEIPRDSEVSCLINCSTSRTQEICTKDKCLSDLFVTIKRGARNQTLKTECRNLRKGIDNLMTMT